MSCITLTTDFGLADPFVGVMKGVIAERAPGCTVIDVTHGIPPQDVMAGALALLQAAPYFPDRAVHVAVVDPGVGGPRLAIAIETERALFVGPDNGVLSLAAAAQAVRRIVALTETRFHLPCPSATFHGRDVFAPVAAALASGTPVDALGTPRETFVRLTIPAPVEGMQGTVGEIIHVDRFGNLTTNLSAARLIAASRREVTIVIGGRTAGMVVSYQDIPRGELGVVANSWGYLEIAARDASAAEMLRAARGTRVTLHRAPTDG
jgi:S-adenosyl-L-methionine hydrolase (adenosine-forming)